MATQIAKLTISLPINLISFADEVANEKKISRSKVISDCLQRFAQKRKVQLMEEGYKAMAKENRDFAKMTFELQRRAVPEWE